MDYFVQLTPFTGLSTPCLLLGYYEERELTPSAKVWDDALHGFLSTLLARDDLSGKAGECLIIPYLPSDTIERILLVGLGKRGSVPVSEYRKALSSASKSLQSLHVKEAMSCLHEAEVEGHDAAWAVRQYIESLENTLYRFTHMKTEDTSKPVSLSTVYFSADESDRASIEKAIDIGKAISQGVRCAKDLANLPGNVCTPTYLSQQALTLSETYSTSLKVEILNEEEIDTLGMGAFQSVSKGSEEPPRFIIMEYKGTSSDIKPYVFIGKGLTFDAGGISLKPALGMDEMKYDMCGGAAVIGTMVAVAELALPLNVVGLIPCSENLPSGKANKPGDIVKSMAGITIEILNTDAEGRLLLCDALTYAQRYQPVAIVDIATLTGACVTALGRLPSGLWSQDDALAEALIAAGDTTYDRVWRMPLWEEYQELLKSHFADVANIGGPEGGSVTAACFLSRFAKGLAWAHLDIAGTAWTTGKEKAATGRPIPLLVQYLLDRLH